jgi:hypothetical protein
MGEATATSDRAKEQVQQKAQDAQEKVKEGAATLRSRAREQVDQRSTQAGEQMSSSAQALRSTGERFREEGQDGPARAAERAADQAERLGGYLTESDADRILRDVEDFGRRQPLAVAAIGFAAGFAASRFLKASSSSRYASRPPQPAALGEGIGGDVRRTASAGAVAASPTNLPDER